MEHAGFVLVGGKSSRMGRDKALLPFRGGALVEHVARAVAAAAGTVTLVGPHGPYAHLGFPILADRHPGLGPLGAIETALTATSAEWNLVVACDMPEVTVPMLTKLIEDAEASGADCFLPVGPAGLPEPLCAVYHRRCLAAIDAALQSGVRKVTAALAGLRVAGCSLPESTGFQNVNTPLEWTPYRNV